mgnify:FL=1
MAHPRLPLLALSLSGLVTFAAPASDEVPPFAVSLTGAVRTPLTVTTGSFSGLLTRTHVVRVSGPAGNYRGTFEVEGVTLRELIEKAEVAKRTDVNFDRPLDLAVVVTGRDGRRAVFSWGEIFIGGGNGPLVVDQLRPFIPHHHEPIRDPRFAPGMRLGLEARAKLDVSGCASCHDGGKVVKIDVPRGLCLVPTGDTTGRRFVEDVVSIEVRQAGFPAPERKKDLEDPWVEAPPLVLPDGTSIPLSAKALKRLPRVEGEGDAVGLGRGFRGRSRWEGVSLAALLKRSLPAGTDPGLLFVVVTASDGYRSLYSGGEILLSRLPENVVLVDTEDGKPLLRKSGRLKSLARGDLFVDRSVRSLAEIRCVQLP